MGAGFVGNATALFQCEDAVEVFVYDKDHNKISPLDLSSYFIQLSNP